MQFLLQKAARSITSPSPHFPLSGWVVHCRVTPDRFFRWYPFIHLGYVYTGPDRNRFEPNRTGSASVYLEPFGTDPSLYTGPFKNRSGTDPNRPKTGPTKLQVQFWNRWDPFRTGSIKVLCRQKAYPVRFLDQIHLVPFRTGPV